MKTASEKASHLRDFLLLCDNEGYPLDLAEVRINPDLPGHHVYIQADWIYGENYSDAIFDTLWILLQESITDEEIRASVHYLTAHNEPSRESGHAVISRT